VFLVIARMIVILVSSSRRDICESHLSPAIW